MRFRVTRTSNRITATEPPCDNCINIPKTYPGGTFDEWYIDLKNGGELLAFIKEHGEVVITNHKDNNFEIEIYDDYRE